MNQKFRITLIIGVLILGFLETSGYGGWRNPNLSTTDGPAFVVVGGLPVGTAGQQYQFKLEAIGGTPPYTFSDFVGLGLPALPAGITLDRDGTLSGAPDTSGEYSVGFTVTDSNNQSTTALFPMNILTPDGVQGVRRLMLSSAKGDNPGPGGSLNFFFADDDGVWHVSPDLLPSGQPSGFIMTFINPANSSIPNPASFFLLSLSTRQLGVPFTAGVYDNCQRAGFAEPGHPGLDLELNGAGCDLVTGSFTVNSVTFDPSGNLETLDATFIQHCEVATAPPLSGHIIYGLAPPAPSSDEPTIQTATYNPKKKSGTLSLTGKNFNSQCSLLIDGHQFVIDTNLKMLKEKVGPALIKATEVNLSHGVHQLQVVDLTGQLSPEFALTVH